MVRSNFKTLRTGVQKSWSEAGHPYPGPPDEERETFARFSDDLNISDGHPFQLLGEVDGDIGGNFWAVKRSFRESSSSANWTIKGAFGNRFEGGQYALSDVIGNSTFPIVIPSNDSTLDFIGSAIISNVIPTNPVSGLATALVELKREGIPSVPGINSWKDRTFRAKQAGGEYLNYEFGWLPLLSDLKKFHFAVSHSHELLKQYEKNSGRRIKRRVTLPTEILDTTVEVTPRYPSPAITGPLSSIYDGQGVLTTTTQVKIERWFSGCFSYYLPPYDPQGDNLARNEQLGNYLYGTRPTPEVLWNLTPWTWALDWVANTGVVLHNISQFALDGLVMPYAYIMEKKTVNVSNVLEQTYQGSPPNPSGHRTFFQDFEVISKYRKAATPYGFGLDPGTFSDRQWSILVALGLSRGNKQMRYQ